MTMTEAYWQELEEQERRLKQEVLLFLRNSGIRCGGLEGFAMIWAGMREEQVHVNIRWEQDKNLKSGNGTIPLTVMRGFLKPASPPWILAHHPDWDVSLPEEVDAAETWHCCDQHWNAFKAGLPLPEHCDVLRQRKGGDDKPYFGYPLGVYETRLDRYVLGERERRERGKPGTVLSGHPLFGG